VAVLECVPPEGTTSHPETEAPDGRMWFGLDPDPLVVRESEQPETAARATAARIHGT
jgi:hypothetical protein